MRGLDKPPPPPFLSPELIQGPGVLPNRRGKQVVKRERGREVHVGWNLNSGLKWIVNFNVDFVFFGRSPLLVSCCGGTRRAKNEYFPTRQGRKVLVFCSTSHGTTSWSAGNTTRRQTPTNVPHSPGACPTRVPRCSCCQNDCWWPDCRDLGPFRTTSRHRWWSSSGGTRIQSR